MIILFLLNLIKIITKILMYSTTVTDTYWGIMNHLKISGIKSSPFIRLIGLWVKNLDGMK